MTRSLCALLVLVAGCSADDLLEDLPDAGVEVADAALPDGDFGCFDEPWPTEAVDPLTLTGRLVDTAGAGVVGATVEILAAEDLDVLGSTTTLGSPLPNDRGRWSVPIATGGTALRLIRKASLFGRVDSYMVDAAPVSAQFTDVVVLSLTPQARDNYATALGHANDPTTGQLWVVVLDCAHRVVAGATVEVPGAEVVGYVTEEGTVGTSTNQTETAAGHGTAIAINVPPGWVDVTVRIGDFTYRSWPSLVVAGATTHAPLFP